MYLHNFLIGRSATQCWPLVLLLWACSGGSASQAGSVASGSSCSTCANGGSPITATGGATQTTGGTPITPSDHSGGQVPSGGTTANGSATGGASRNSTSTHVGGATDSGGVAPMGGTPARGGSAPAGAGTATTGGTIAASAGGSGVAGQTGTDHGVPVFVHGPTLIPNDNPSAPLAATLSVETDVPTTGSVLISGGGESWTVNLDSALVHDQALLGFKPNTDYGVTLTVAQDGVEVSAAPLSWHSPALPADFPHLMFVQSDPSRMAPGMTMFDVIARAYVIVVDSMGEVRWYYHAPRGYDRYRLLTAGSILCVSDNAYLTEIDWFGNAINTWYASNSGTPPSGTIPVAVNSFHHNVDEMPNGNFLLLSQEVRVISNFPTSSSDPAAPTAKARVTGDQLVEITRKGEVVKQYSLFDIIDPTRIGHDGEDHNDWTHSNAVIYDSASDAYLVSMRHQDAVIKLRRDTGELVWILGNHANWREQWQPKLLTPLGTDFEWQYHQHAIELTQGGLLLYDNGNYRAPAYQEPVLPLYSRAVRFAIDEEAMTVEQLWTYQPRLDGAPLYSYAMSDADSLQNGNVLVNSGTLTSERAQPGWAQIVEVEASGESTFEIRVIDLSSAYTTFDADRIPDIRYMTNAHGSQPAKG